MAVDLSELLALPPDERLRLAEELWASLAPDDLAELIGEFAERSDRTIRALDATISRLESLDKILARDRAEVRGSVLRDHEEWPFELASRSQ